MNKRQQQERLLQMHMFYSKLGFSLALRFTVNPLTLAIRKELLFRKKSG